MSKATVHAPASPAPPPTVRLPAWVRWGILLLLVGSVAAAIWQWNAPRPDDVLQWMTAAEQALQRGDVAVSYESLHKVAMAAPQTPGVQEMLADLAIRQGLVDEAETWIAKSPDGAQPRLQLSLGVKALELSRATLAETRLRSLLQGDPGLVPARQLLIRLYLLTMREQPLRTEIAALDTLPEGMIESDNLLLFCIGTRASWLEREPVEWLRRAVTNDPQDGASRAALAAIEIQATRREAARQLLQESAPSDREAWRVQLIRIQDLLDAGKFDEAQQALTQVGILADGEAAVWLARGRLATEKNDPRAAAGFYEHALRIDPFASEPVYRLARLARTAKDDALAKTLFSRADLLDQLHRASMRALNAPQERQAALQQVATLVADLNSPRLAVLFTRALLKEFPNLKLTEKLEKLQKLPGAQQLLSQSLLQSPVPAAKP